MGEGLESMDSDTFWIFRESGGEGRSLGFGFGDLGFGFVSDFDIRISGFPPGSMGA
jgi:hypothetical protein